MKNEKRPAGPATDAAMSRATRRGFLVGAAGLIAGISGWTWLRTRAEELGTPWPFRGMLELNGRLARKYFQSSRREPELDPVTGEARENGEIGLETELDLDAWRLTVQGPRKDLQLRIEELKALPRFEQTIRFKCIEGWSEPMTFAGARFSDLLERYQLGRDPKTERLMEYVALETPDRQYYVSLDMETMRHPQTLLCFAMNGAELPDEHGAPLRLVTPLKYGVKNLKRIGAIRFSNERPPDYWAEQGYDWYAGL